MVLQGEREMAKDNRKLGNFKLEGIRPAPRGLPQIEVTFDIDANGILNVSAKDKETGKEQQITISNSTNLDESEINRMVDEARIHADEDKKQRAMADAKNELEAAAYQVERVLSELGDKAPAHEKARGEELVREAREAVSGGADISRLQALTQDLKQAAAALSQHAPSGSDSQGESPEEEPDKKDGDDVIDAEFNEG